MKNLFITITFCLTLAAGIFAADEHAAKSGSNTSPVAGRAENAAIVLDGNQFCRTVKSDGLFGQPAGERQHCVSFKSGKMTDDANTFFGNPPETLPYKILGKKILVKRDGEWKPSYDIDGDTLVSGTLGAGAKLEKVVRLENRQFCRTVKSGGLFGQPAGERQHCVSFKDNKMTDNANTFFGNPPETLPYKISGKKILVQRNGEWKPAYSVDGDTLVNDAGAKLEEKK